jgi:hypothetical protein
VEHRAKPVAFAVLILVVLGSLSATAGDPAFLAARERNPSLKAYSFRVDVVMRMRSFPWLHFRLAGTGTYLRGRRYVIEFSETPFFARSVKTIDLSALDPTMWQDRFIVRIVSQKNGMTTFDLRERNIESADNPLLGAEVTLDSNDATREVVFQYAKGEIALHLSPSDIQGYRLPVSTDADIKMPGNNLSAHADFTDYRIEQTTYG